MEGGRVGEDTTQAGAAEDETTDTSSRMCCFSHTWQREKKAARRTSQVTMGTVKSPFPRIFRVQRQLQMQSESIASICEMMLGMVKEKAVKERQGAAYHA